MEITQDVFPNLSERLTGLGELAMNLWWSRHPAARMLFKMLDRQVWKQSVHNPIKMLKELPREILESAASDSDYIRHYDVVLAQFREDKDARGR
jgi:starch phosphorylase